MSEDLNLDDSAFFFSLPVFVITDQGVTGEQHSSAVRLFQIDGETCLTLFTDQDLAERFIASEKLLRRDAREVGQQVDLQEIVRLAREQGATQVAMDVSGRRGRFFPVSAFLEAIVGDEEE